LALLAPAALATQVDPPVAIDAHRADQTRILGRVSSYDDSGFSYLDPNHQPHEVRWEELDAANVLRVNEAILGRGTAQQWVELGRRLLKMRNGTVPADRAFTRAVRLDPASQAKIEAIKRGEDPDEPNAPATTAPFARASQSERDASGPQIEGDQSQTTWPKLSDAQQARAIAELKAFVDQTRQQINPRLDTYETKFFIFCSDLPQAEAQSWAGVLDRMYARLAELFAIPKGEKPLARQSPGARLLQGR